MMRKVQLRSGLPHGFCHFPRRCKFSESSYPSERFDNIYEVPLIKESPSFDSRASAELNAATDNPLVFDEVISGCNFHGEPLALAADYLSPMLPYAR